ncbi:hypothetical protein EDB84DRAFT_1516786 [Lactarius hengduanensis]|nr:hypothetical protein EDB84DRAFT_1544800 [Lactarius hengduanensis]KAH9019616.1 hypothetical protein EDB84DRAFT_1516786 [Lactarius hengduanensis]
MFSPSSSALQAVRNPRSKSASKAALTFHQSLTTLILRHPDLLIHLVWSPRDEELEGQNVAHHQALAAARLDPPDNHHFRSAAFQKRRARAEAFHNWAFDFHLARVEGEWREITRGLPPEGHAHTHVLLRPPDGNNHPLWSAATDCERDDKNRKILSRPLYKRRTTSTTFQLAVDHAFTGSYAARFRPRDPPNAITCPCGWGLRDPPHLILSCPRYFNNRIDSGVSGQYWPLTYKQLFTTSKGAKRLLDYLQSSRAGSQPEFGPLPPPPDPD